MDREHVPDNGGERLMVVLQVLLHWRSFTRESSGHQFLTLSASLLQSREYNHCLLRAPRSQCDFRKLQSRFSCRRRNLKLNRPCFVLRGKPKTRKFKSQMSTAPEDRGVEIRFQLSFGNKVRQRRISTGCKSSLENRDAPKQSTRRRN